MPRPHVSVERVAHARFADERSHPELLSHAELTPHDRLHEVARLLAVGVRRLLTPARDTSGTPPHVPASALESGRVCLEVSVEVPLSVHPG